MFVGGAIIPLVLAFFAGSVEGQLYTTTLPVEVRLGLCTWTLASSILPSQDSRGEIKRLTVQDGNTVVVSTGTNALGVPVTVEVQVFVPFLCYQEDPEAEGIGLPSGPRPLYLLPVPP